jgi:hypothetical protein
MRGGRDAHSLDEGRVHRRSRPVVDEHDPLRVDPLALQFGQPRSHRFLAALATLDDGHRCREPGLGPKPVDAIGGGDEDDAVHDTGPDECVECPIDDEPSADPRGELVDPVHPAR